MGTLLEAIGIVLETHFGFGFPNRSPVRDNLIAYVSPGCYCHRYSNGRTFTLGYRPRTCLVLLFYKISTVVFSFVFDKYYSIIN
jgi:hypothetical protein